MGPEYTLTYYPPKKNIRINGKYISQGNEIFAICEILLLQLFQFYINLIIFWVDNINSIRIALEQTNSKGVQKKCIIKTTN